MTPIWKICAEHLGGCWWRREWDDATLMVLLDRCMEDGRTLEMAVSQLLRTCLDYIKCYRDLGKDYYSRWLDSLKRAVRSAGLDMELNHVRI
jgi:hypothetical protein